MMIGMVGMIAFNLIDTWFVARLGTLSLAAMGFTLPVVLLQGAISMGLGVGASAVISRTLGAGEWGRVRRITSDALVLSLGIVLGVVILGQMTIDPLFRSMGAGPGVLPLIRQYMRTWYWGVPFVVIPMVGNNAMRAAGNTLLPSLVMLTAITVNVILDPLLIFGLGPFPAMGIRGAALATVFARATTLILSLTLLRIRFDMLTARVPKWREFLQSCRALLHVGVPAALTQVITPVSFAVVTGLVAGYGPAAVAALGVGTRIEAFAMSPIMALSSVMVPFTGQNDGAGHRDRVAAGAKVAGFVSLVVGLLCFILLAPGGGILARLFVGDPAVVQIVRWYLVVAPLGYGLQGVLLSTSSVFNGLHRPLAAAGLVSLRMVALYLPLAYLGSVMFGLPGVFAGAAISSIGAGGLGWWLLKRVLARAETPRSSR